jgi:hypothetical protein
MGTFQASYTLNPELITLIESKMRLAMYHGSKFADMIGRSFAEKMGREQEVLTLGPGQTQGFTGAPVETVAGFLDQGGLTMDIPVVDRLTDLPGALGDGALEGTEETAKYTFRRVQVHRTRKAYAPPVGMQRQATKKWKRWLVTDAEPKLRQHLSDYMPSNILSALHFGYSRELIASAASNGGGVTPVSHPNMFVAGSGAVSYAGGRPGTAGYEAAVETAIDGMSNMAQFKMTPDFIANMVQEAPRKKIRPIISKSGYPLYPIFVKDTQFNQLRAHANYKELALSLAVAKLESHPLAHLGECIMFGALIISDLKMWCAYTNALGTSSGLDTGITAGTVEYGPRPTAAQRAKGFLTGNTITNLDTGDVACCVLLGESALSIATAEEVTFHENLKDYEGVQGVGYDMIKSAVRNETFNYLGLITALAKDAFYENTGSILGLSWSPYALTYS